jgi:hypothetical protein
MLCSAREEHGTQFEIWIAVRGFKLSDALSLSLSPMLPGCICLLSRLSASDNKLFACIIITLHSHHIPIFAALSIIQGQHSFWLTCYRYLSASSHVYMPAGPRLELELHFPSDPRAPKPSAGTATAPWALQTCRLQCPRRLYGYPLSS